MRLTWAATLVLVVAATASGQTRPTTQPTIVAADFTRGPQTTDGTDQDDGTVRGLVDDVLRPADWNQQVASRAIYGLKRACGGKVGGGRLLPLLEPYWAGAAGDPDRAAAAYVVYLGVTGQDPPGVERLDGVGHFVLAVQGRAGATVADVRAELRARLTAGTVEAGALGQYHGRAWARLAVDGVGRRRRAVDALRHSRVVTVADDVSGTLPVLFTPAEYADFVHDARSGRPATRPDYAVAFRDLYDHLGRTYPEFQMKGIDWPAVGRELLPRAAAVRTDGEFGLLVEQLVARLQDSHAVVEPGTAAVPAPDLPAWDPGFACLDDDRDRPVIYVVEPGSPADRAGMKPGVVVVTVDGMAADDAVRGCMRRLSEWAGYSSDRTLRYDAVRSFAARADYGTVIHLTLEATDGHRSTADVAATCGGRYLPRLPVPRAGVTDSADLSSTLLRPGVGYVYVRRIGSGLEAGLDSALRSLGPLHGLVIDVRGNSGGGFDAAAAFANFDPHETRWPDRPRYAGPIAVLTDARCISAGEGWASWFVSNHRARLFGSITAGASCRKEEYTLTGGLFKVIVPVKPYTGFLDRVIEREGLVPDAPVRCTAADLAAGRDTVVDTAVRWFDGQH